MIIARLIYYTTILVWIFPPFRQRGHRYFLFFLILALSDPVWFILPFTDATFFYLIISTLLFAALLKKKILLLLLIPVLFAGIYLTPKEMRILTIITHFGILTFFLKEFIIIISRESRIIIFNLILLLYETSVIFKFSSSYFMTAGYMFFYITTAFELLLAAFFTFVNEINSPVIKLQMEPDPES